MKIIVLVLCSLILTGCAAGFLSPEQIEALGKDPATVCISAPTPYGPVRFARTNLPNGIVQCDSEGLRLRSDPPAVKMPL